MVLNLVQVKIDTINKIIELTNKGFTRREISEKTGVSKSTVYKYQKKFGLLGL